VLRQAEVKNLGLIPLRDEDVCRLDVAVNNSFCMRSVKRVGHLNCKIQQQPHLHGAPIYLAFERLALKKFHRDEISSVTLPDLVNGADVRMVQGRCRPRLSLKAL
jgi:hypothetical protein